MPRSRSPASACPAGAGPPGLNREIVLSAIEIFSGFRGITKKFSALEQRALFHDNAIRIYAMEWRVPGKLRIGYVGAGLMGLPMVKRLVSLGYARAYDIVYDRTASTATGP